jgi:hypothetical protein
MSLQLDSRGHSSLQPENPMQSFERCAIGAQNATYFARQIRRFARLRHAQGFDSNTRAPRQEVLYVENRLSARAPLPVAQHR